MKVTNEIYQIQTRIYQSQTININLYILNVSLIEDHEKMNKRPALPDCPMPITPDVTQVLLNINECSYMDAIECRGITKVRALTDN